MTDRRSGAQRGWPKGATAQMGLPSKWSGAVWRGRQPEPTPSFTKSRSSVSPLVIARASARGDPLCPKNRTGKTRYANLETRWIAASDYRPPRNDRVRCHREGRARGDPLCTKKRTDKPRKIYLETRWIAASLRSSQ